MLVPTEPPQLVAGVEPHRVDVAVPHVEEDHPDRAFVAHPDASHGRTWEKGGFAAHLRAILDDDGRPMVLINWNTDMGDGWEWSNAEEYPGYPKWTRRPYQMRINEIVYALTH